MIASRFMRVGLVAAILVGALTTSFAVAKPAEAATGHRTCSTRHTNGATSTLCATITKHKLVNVRAYLHLPRADRNNRVAAALQHEGGSPVIRNGWWVTKVDRGRRNFRFILGDVPRTKPGYGIYFDDFATVYDSTHPYLR